MKKIITFLMSLCLCVMMVASFAACGKDDKEFSSVQEYLESDDVQAQVQQFIASVDGSGMKMDITAEGDSLVYTCTFETQIDVTEEIKDYFENAYETQQDTMDDMLEQMGELISVKNPSVIFRYLNADGTEISSHEYSK